MQNDLISRSALLKEFEKRQEQQTNEYCDCFLNDAQELSTEWWCVEDAVMAAPTIDAVPVVHGRWIEHPQYDVFGDCCYIDYECSVCHNIACEDAEHYAYCPNCGQPMDAKDMDVSTKNGGAQC